MNNTEGIFPISDALSIAHEIMDDLGLSGEKEGTVIRWLFQAQIEMGVPVQFTTKVECIEVSDCAAKKPCDYIRTVELGLRYGKEGEIVIPYYRPMSHEFVLNGCCNLEKHNCHDYSIREDTWHWSLSSNANGMELVVRYQAYAFDELGYPHIDRNNIEALRAYVRWKHFMQINTRGYPAKGNIGVEQYAQREFAKWAQYGRGKKTLDQLSKTMIQQISQRWNDPYYITMNPYRRANINQNTYIRGSRIE
jgi:hypothetical protein